MNSIINKILLFAVILITMGVGTRSADASRYIATGTYHTCGIPTWAGGVKCWGNDSWGQLGDGTYNNIASPVSVVGRRNYSDRRA